MKLIEDKLVSDIEEGKSNSLTESERRSEIVVSLIHLCSFCPSDEKCGGIAVVDVRNEICTGCRMKVPAAVQSSTRNEHTRVMSILLWILVHVEGMAESAEDAI